MNEPQPAPTPREGMTHDDLLALGAKPPRNLGRAEVETMGIPEFDARRRQILCVEPGCLNRVLTAGPYPVFCPEHEKEQE